MPRPLIHPDLVRLRDKYPASRCLRDEWPEIKKLVTAGKSDEAEALIKTCIASNPKLVVRGTVIAKTRVGRREFLKGQREVETLIKASLSRLGERISSLLISNAGPDGKISPGRMNRVLVAVKTVNTEAWSEILLAIKAAVRDSIGYGIGVNMDGAEAGLEKAKAVRSESRESNEKADLDFAYMWWKFYEDRGGAPADISEAVRARIRVSSDIYKTIFDRVKKRQLQQGLFRNKFRGQFQSGTTLSRRVWDVRDQTLTRLRRTVAGGIAQGRPASAISSDVKGMTTVGQTSRFFPNPGSGVYRSAYRNALRMVRTETNNAYVDAQLEYVIHKGYKVLWNLSPGHPEEDECDDLAGKVYDPESVPYPNHPNEACFLTTVLPEVG